MEDRYSRQQLFRPIGMNGQQLLQQKHVLIIGVGALGSASAEALVRAGIGRLTIVDRDYVEWSNLQRQQLYTEADAHEKLPKVIAAKARLQAINSQVIIDAHILDASSPELLLLLETVDVMIDATDNFDIRFIINDISTKYKIPWVYGSCVSSYGAVYTIIPGETPCFHCLLDVIPTSTLTCDTAGIISPAVQIVAAYQVAEALKLVTNNKEAVNRKYKTFDVWQNQNMDIDVGKMRKMQCPCCGEQAIHPYLAYENQTKLDVLCGRDAVQIRPPKAIQYNFSELVQQLQQHGHVQSNAYLLSYEVPEYRFVLFQDGRVVIHGIRDEQQAKKIYYQLLG
ncbi:MoeB/ThiF family adenylyltransferase [Kurthia sibirica]|uniref:Thiamine biosynthesis protein MoeB n=1 Tax=Kurthia sibirica TaxID=202750 RepID=A0A2U3AKQ0_9BACL|nr:MoeB/ThiF family adenylyltransferase [Kurthia sibirica]PWI25118.1 thiamine biosynthesis protein MoeB [Kurthia sibirica]GEK34039.1 thiamine/molybdopterin biosynthesis protein MoeB [Kurthia sibirica]